MPTWCITFRRFQARCRHSGRSQAQQDPFLGDGRLFGAVLGGGRYCRGTAVSAGGAVILGHFGGCIDDIVWCTGRMVSQPAPAPTLTTADADSAALSAVWTKSTMIPVQ